MPRSIVFSRTLLTIQACLWAVAIVAAAVIVAEGARWNVVGHTAAHAAAFISVSVTALLLMASLGAGSAYLAANLKPGRPRIRLAAVAVESFMACFGVFGAYVESTTGAGLIAGVPVLAGFVGALLSLTAAILLLCAAARRFTASARPA